MINLVPSPKLRASHISPHHTKLISSIDKNKTNKSKQTGRINTYNNELLNFMAEKKKFHLKINLNDNITSNNIRERNIISRSKSPVELENNFNSSIGVQNIKNTQENLNLKHHKIGKKTSIYILNTFILTEHINLMEKSKDFFTTPTANNKNTIKSHKSVNNKNSNTNSQRANLETIKKPITTCSIDLKKDFPKQLNPKVVESIPEKQKPNLNVKDQKKKDNNQIHVGEKTRDKSKLEATIDINLDIKTETITNRNNKKEKGNNKTSNNTEKSKRTITLNKEDSLNNKDLISDFACCSIQFVDPIIDIIRKYCDENSLNLKYV